MRIRVALWQCLSSPSSHSMFLQASSSSTLSRSFSLLGTLRLWRRTQWGKLAAFDAEDWDNTATTCPGRSATRIYPRSTYAHPASVALCSRTCPRDGISSLTVSPYTTEPWMTLSLLHYSKSFLTALFVC